MSDNNRDEVIVIDKPLYIQLSDKLIKKIQDELEVGDLLPSERKLTKLYDVSRTTVRLALNYLENRGYVSIQHGKGSFVVDYYKKVINLNDMYSFTEQMEIMGKKPKTKLLDYSIVSDDKELKEQFNQTDRSFIKLVRLRLADDTPMLYEETYIPVDKFQSVSAEDIDTRSLYDIFREDYDEIVKMAQEEFSAGIVTTEIANYLDMEYGAPVLKIYRTTLNLNNEVIEYTITNARPDKFTYRTKHYNHLT